MSRCHMFWYATDVHTFLLSVNVKYNSCNHFSFPFTNNSNLECEDRISFNYSKAIFPCFMSCVEEYFHLWIMLISVGVPSPTKRLLWLCGPNTRQRIGLIFIIDGNHWNTWEVIWENYLCLDKNTCRLFSRVWPLSDFTVVCGKAKLLKEMIFCLIGPVVAKKTTCYFFSLKSKYPHLAVFQPERHTNASFPKQRIRT